MAYMDCVPRDGRWTSVPEIAHLYNHSVSRWGAAEWESFVEMVGEWLEREMRSGHDVSIRDRVHPTRGREYRRLPKEAAVEVLELREFYWDGSSLHFLDSGRSVAFHPDENWLWVPFQDGPSHGSVGVREVPPLGAVCAITRRGKILSSVENRGEYWDPTFRTENVSRLRRVGEVVL